MIFKTTTKLLHKKKNKTKQKTRNHGCNSSEIVTDKMGLRYFKPHRCYSIFSIGQMKMSFSGVNPTSEKNKRRETNLRGDRRFTTTIKAEIRKTHIAGFHVLVQ